MLIGLAHGSRHARVASGVESVLAATSLLVGVETRAAYLDLTDPDLGAVAADLAATGVRRAVVVPLLFTDAFHARIDVPEAVGQAADSVRDRARPGPDPRHRRRRRSPWSPIG